MLEEARLLQFYTRLWHQDALEHHSNTREHNGAVLKENGAPYIGHDAKEGSVITPHKFPKIKILMGFWKLRLLEAL
ncbi:Uncharacterized protein TCM_023909 [Theobroma cacao]|uniref:Uncharacterized protein n=1 Tax=Theobroma cacao TaxID=3641 RepID=A0A061EVE8_THECC|nr:Uncharacterized protein TCM_023909 [Theobroma cacao]